MNWFLIIKKFYDSGLWTSLMVQNAVIKGKITIEEKNQIFGIVDDTENP